MFAKGDRVFHNDYGTGTIFRILPKEIIKQKDCNNNELKHIGVVEVAFDSEYGELDGKDNQKTVTFLSDGRSSIPGSGYFWKFLFNIISNQNGYHGIMMKI